MADIPRDGTETPAHLQAMYGLTAETIGDMMGAAPYVQFCCTLIDLHFNRATDNALTPEVLGIMSDFVDAALHKAQEVSNPARYLNDAFCVLGAPHPCFPEELNYARALPAMRLLLPRLLELKLDTLKQRV